MRRSYARHLAIFFPAILVVAVFMLIKPSTRSQNTTASDPKPQQNTNEFPRRFDHPDREKERARRWEVRRELLIEKGYLTEGMSEEEELAVFDKVLGRFGPRDPSEDDNSERAELRKELELRYLEEGIGHRRWHGRGMGQPHPGEFGYQGVGIFEGRGLTLGDTVPSMQVFDINGQPVQLSQTWQDRPVLLVTGSITCGFTQECISQLDALSRRFSSDVNVVLLYTLEAMPNDEEAPGPAGEALAEQYESSDVPSYPQPKSLQQRLELAKAFRDQCNVQSTILVDTMNNDGWQAFGQAPGMAVLITPDGKVAHKEGWFNAYVMADEIEAELRQ